MKMIKKISIIAIILMIAFIVTPQKANAAFDTGTIINGGQAFLNNAENRQIFNANNERSAVDQIYYTMLTIGIVLAVFAGGVLGIQFITSGAAGQAKVKEKLIPFALGALVIFGAFGIWRLVYNILNGYFY
ncbi:MAG: hypothetical protein IKE91_08565 [Clostridia bacterium]|nr:hypothetical protein [Clostridia bacterium]